ncbi:MAG: ADP-forming succinate--CoA ligase subunit beta [Planctomycetota bacterium]
MKLHEVQAKEILKAAGLPVPQGCVADSLESLERAVRKIGRFPVVLKAQIHAGGRGKAGGVRIAKDAPEAASLAKALFGRRLVTAQTPPEGLPVDQILVEPAAPASRELYLAATIDRRAGSSVVLASASGGCGIGEAASHDPGALVREVFSPAEGLHPFQARLLASRLGLSGQVSEAFAEAAMAVARVLVETDAMLVETNPLALLESGHLSVLDARIEIEDNALFRHPDLECLRDVRQEDALERRAQASRLSYIPMDGDIACLVNGAGLAMATMDLIRLHGGRPANFLDLSGGASAAQVGEAFRILFSEPRVKAVLVNIFGGIVKCDTIALGILEAVRAVGIRSPLVVRLEGTHVEEGRKLLRESGLPILAADGLDEAARKAVEAAKGGA